jgi:iron complex transport system permease protein
VGLAIAVSGPVAFVALIAPHAARGIIGRLDGGGMVVAALLGALLLIGSDMVAQHLFTYAIPAGAVTAAVGAPYFLFILYRGARAGVL